MTRLLASAMGFAARRALLVGLVLTALAAGGAAFAATTLHPTTATDTLVSRGSASYQASARFHRQFGDDAVYVLVDQPLKFTVLTKDLGSLIGLEGCISGNVPQGETPYGGAKSPCGRLAQTKPAQLVLGPGTFLNESVNQITQQLGDRLKSTQAQGEQAAAAARQVAKARGYSKARQDQLAAEARQLTSAQAMQTLMSLGTEYGISSLPRLDDPSFVSKVVFEEGRPAGTPKAKFAYLFPSPNAALIQVRLRPSLSQAARRHAIALIRQAVRMRDFRLTQGHGHYVVTGAPVVVGDLAASVTDSSKTLLLAAIVVMALALALVFRTTLRLLPLLVALVAVGLTFGLLALVGGSLTIASIAVLPVLTGLVVDYAIQLQSRLQEERRRMPEATFEAVVAQVARRGAPTIATAALATAAGFLALLFSPVPMVRGFGVLMVAGVFIGVLCAVTLGVAVLSLGGRRQARGALGASLRGAGELVFDNRAAGWLRRVGGRARESVLGAAMARPGRVLAAALVIAVAGWVLDTQTRVESDITKLAPQNLRALHDLRHLEDETGVGGEIDVVVRADQGVTSPDVVKWMAGYQQKLISHYGYSVDRGCGRAQLCPAFSLPSLLGSGGAASKKQADAILDAVPTYFSRGVISGDRRTATLAFGLRLMSLERQETVVQTMRRAMDPPKGVHVALAGLPVLAADANARVASPWRRLLLAGLGLLAVGAVLLLTLRDRRRALVPLVPIVLATGWSSLVLWATRIPLNPLSVTLGALVIAISTEFSVLLSERFHSERRLGAAVGPALRRAYASTGAAVLASGTTAICGFAVLMSSDIKMLRDFGAVTVIDLLVSLLGVLVVLPAVLVAAERRGHRDDRRRPTAAAAEAAASDGVSEQRRSRFGRSSQIAALAGVLLVGYVTVNTLSSKGPGSAGPKVGAPAPPFTGPTPDGDTKHNVDVARRANQGNAGKVPACDLHLPRSINACDLWRRRPTVVVFLATRSAGGCVKEMDVVDRIAARRRAVAFVGVSISGSARTLRSLIAKRGWRFPIVYDRDGRLANLYGVAACPLITYVKRGGIVAGSNVGELGESELDAAVSRLVSGQDPKTQ